MPDVTSIIQQAIEHYKPGGEFATTRGTQLAEKRGAAIAGAEAGLVGRGLAGTTVGAAIPAAFEQQIATPWRTETEMMRGGRLMEAVLAKAGFAERAEARASAEALAREEMELRQKLADRQISLQEYMAATARIAARRQEAGGGAGAGAGGFGPEPGFGFGPGDEAGTAGTGYDVDYINQLLGTLMDGGDAAAGEDYTGWTHFPAGGGEGYEVDPTWRPSGEYEGGVIVSESFGEAPRYPIRPGQPSRFGGAGRQPSMTDLGRMAEQWLTESF